MPESCIYIFGPLPFKHSNIDGITGFGEEDSQSVLGFMKYATQLAKCGNDMVAIVLSLCWSFNPL